jgi:hypothetical protein
VVFGVRQFNGLRFLLFNFVETFLGKSKEHTLRNGSKNGRSELKKGGHS